MQCMVMVLYDCIFQEKERRHFGVLTSKARQTLSSAFYGEVILPTYDTNDREKKKERKKKEGNLLLTTANYYKTALT